MANYADDDVKGIVEEMAEDRGRAMNRTSTQKRSAGASSRTGLGRALLFGGIAMVALVVALFLLLGKGDPEQDEGWHRLTERVERMESTLNRLETTSEELPALLGRIEGLGKSVSRLESNQRTLMDRVDRLSRRMDALAETRGSSGARAPQASEGRTTENPSTHTVQQGETLFRIAKRYGLSIQELCTLNGMNRNEVIQPGQKLIVGKGD